MGIGAPAAGHTKSEAELAGRGYVPTEADGLLIFTNRAFLLSLAKQQTLGIVKG
jgi:hypothetical protein